MPVNLFKVLTRLRRQLLSSVEASFIPYAWTQRGDSTVTVFCVPGIFFKNSADENFSSNYFESVTFNCKLQSREAKFVNKVFLSLRIFECDILFVTPVTCPKKLCSNFAVTRHTMCIFLEILQYVFSI